MTRLGRFIDRILEEKEIDFNDFITKSGISKSYYYKLSKDPNVSLSVVVATNIARGLKLYPEEFFEGIGVIGVINEYLITEEQALSFMQSNDEFIKMCGLDVGKMTIEEINEYANFIFKCMKMASYKYL